ncbi:MAG: 30S ribosomal protein S6 [Bacteroidota bacterium]
MRNYEVTFIVDPVLSGDEIKAAAQAYVDLLKKEGCEIVHVDEMGLRQLAYPINKRTSGVYYCIEFQVPTGELISKIELSMRRDERIMRFLTVRLDKYGVKYNDDKRKGLIGKKKKSGTAKAESNAPKRERGRGGSTRTAPPKSAPKPTPKAPEQPAAKDEEE